MNTQTTAPANIQQAIAFAQSDDLGQLIEAHDFAMSLGRQIPDRRAAMPAGFAGLAVLREGFTAGQQLPMRRA